MYIRETDYRMKAYHSWEQSRQEMKTELQSRLRKQIHLLYTNFATLSSSLNKIFRHHHE